MYWQFLDIVAYISWEKQDNASKCIVALPGKYQESYILLLIFCLLRTQFSRLMLVNRRIIFYFGFNLSYVSWSIIIEYESPQKYIHGKFYIIVDSELLHGP